MVEMVPLSPGLLSSEALARASVLVVGDVMLDRYWFGDVSRISPEAPVPVVHVRREEYRLGGAANVALNVREFGARACLSSVVGDDPDGVRLAQLLDQRGITHDLHCSPGLTTTVKLRVSGRQQQLLRIDFEERPTGEPLGQLLDGYGRRVAQHGAVILSDYGKGGLEHVARMIEIARAHDIPTLVDPKGDNFLPYRGATLITPNRDELSHVVGRWDDEATLVERAQNLRRDLQLGALLVTRSEEGMSLFDDDGHVRIEAQALEVFDVTGAGDTVIAVLGALLAAGISVRDAIPIANHAAAIVIGKFGTSSVSFEEVFG